MIELAPTFIYLIGDSLGEVVQLLGDRTPATFTTRDEKQVFQLSIAARACRVRLDWLDDKLTVLSEVPNVEIEKAKISHLEEVVVDTGISVQDATINLHETEVQL